MTRIPRTESFTKLLATRPLNRTRRLQRFVVPNQGLGSRFAVLIPKRYAKRAVDRHLLKRLARVAHSKWAGQANEDTLVRLVFPVKHVGEKDRLQWWTELQALFNPPSKKL